MEGKSLIKVFKTNTLCDLSIGQRQSFQTSVSQMWPKLAKAFLNQWHCLYGCELRRHKGKDNWNLIPEPTARVLISPGYLHPGKRKH